MFIWNNIFFSLGFDVREHYKDFGGDYAAYIAPVCNPYFSLGVKWSRSVKDIENFYLFVVLSLQGNDLQGVKAYFNLDSEGLYTLGTAVIDYRGYRVTAQSIIPGVYLSLKRYWHGGLQLLFKWKFQLSYKWKF